VFFKTYTALKRREKRRTSEHDSALRKDWKKKVSFTPLLKIRLEDKGKTRQF